MPLFRAIRSNLTEKKYYEKGQVASFDELPSHHWEPESGPVTQDPVPRLGAKIGTVVPKGKPMKAPGKADQANEE